MFIKKKTTLQITLNVRFCPLHQVILICPSKHKPLTLKSTPSLSVITAQPLPSSVHHVCMDETGHYVTVEKGSTAQHSRCLLCENTPGAWPDPDNDQTITQLSHWWWWWCGGRGKGGGVYPEKMRGIRIGVGGPLPDTRPPPQTHTHT